MEKRVVILFLCAISLFFCKSASTRILAFDEFEISIPDDWNYNSKNGTDSFYGTINANGYKLFFDYSEMGFANSLINSKQEYIEYYKKDWLLIALQSIKLGKSNQNLQFIDKDDLIKDYSTISDTTSLNQADVYEDNANYYTKLYYNDVLKTIKIQFPCEIENHNIQIDTLGNFYRKIIYPKKSGEGITGLYLKDLKSNLNFQISSENLDIDTQNQFINMIKTLKLK